MGAQRTSNKDILVAIEQQTNAINALVGVLAGTQNTPPSGEIDCTPVTDPAPKQVSEPTGRKARYEADYLSHMKTKVAELVANDGQSRVLYGRVNKAGEDKLAYALRTRFDAGLKDRGYQGVVEFFDAL